MRVISWTRVLALFVGFSLCACSAEVVDRPDRGENPREGIRVGGGPLPRGGEAMTIARTGGRVSVERAVLSSAGEADLVHVRVEYEGSWVWPRCSLLEGSNAETVRRTIETREPPTAQGYTKPLWEESLWREHESLWADRSTIEKSLQGDGTVLWTFHEDPTPEGEVADPRRTPFFARCAGGDLPDVVHDVAHVLGTPGAAS